MGGGNHHATGLNAALLRNQLPGRIDDGTVGRHEVENNNGCQGAFLLDYDCLRENRVEYPFYGTEAIVACHGRAIFRRDINGRGTNPQGSCFPSTRAWIGDNAANQSEQEDLGLFHCGDSLLLRTKGGGMAFAIVLGGQPARLAMAP
jgi:hypothetical protein